MDKRGREYCESVLHVLMGFGSQKSPEETNMALHKLNVTNMAINSPKEPPVCHKATKIYCYLKKKGGSRSVSLT